MKNFYLYLAGMVLLASGYFMTADTTDPAIREMLYQNKTALQERPTQSVVSKELPLSPLTSTKNTVAKVVAATLTATNSYQITKDLGAPGGTAGDEITYTVTIANSGSDATGVVYNTTIDPNTTLVPGSVTVTPVAQNDGYTSIGNVGLNIPAGSGLFSNDISPDGTALTVTSATSITTAQGGLATITAATGAFTYTPPVGYTGDDSFNYTVQSASGGSSTAKATITLANKIWFVNAGASGTNVGTLANPFNSLSAFQTANNGTAGHPAANEFIFIYSGSYTGPVTLLSGQKLIGQGAGAGLTSITGFAAPSGSAILPSTGGTAPVLTTTGSNVDAVTLNQNNTLRGFSIGATTGKKIKGTSFGTLTASEVSLSGSGPALDLTTGTLSASFPTLSSTTTSTTPAINLTGVSGAFSNSDGTIAATNGAAIQITGTTTLTLGLKFSAVSSSGTAKGISITNTAGTFSINEAGSTAGAGGTFSNISQRAIELTNANGITLKNINFTNASTSNGTVGVDNTGSNGVIYANNVSGLTINNIAVSGTTAQYGLNLVGVTNLALTNSTLDHCGDAPGEGAIYATETKGTNTISSSSFTFPSGRGAYFRNTSGAPKLTISSSNFTDIAAEQGLLVESAGTSTFNLIVNNSCQFKRFLTTAIAGYSSASSTLNADILNATIDPGTSVGSGIDIAGSETSKLNFNILNNNIKVKGGTGINIFSLDGALASGRIKLNTIASNGGLGTGIVARNESVIDANKKGKLTVEINQNTISGISIENGILASSAELSNEVQNINITNNAVGASQTAPKVSDMNIAVNYPVISGNLGNICANIVSNNATNNVSSVGLLGIASPAGTTTVLQGASSVFESWNAKGNLPTAAASGANAAYKSGTGTLTFGSAGCPLPTNAADISVLRVAATENSTSSPVQENGSTVGKETASEKVATVIEEQPAAAKNGESSLRITAETVTVGGSGFTLPAGRNFVITYKVTINSTIPANVCKVTNQGTITATGLTPVLTDDPSVVGASDPTNTAVTPTALPTITQGPVNKAICAGSATSFSVAVVETGLSYQWQKKTGAGSFTNINLSDNSSANSATLNLTNVQTTDNATQYQVIVFSPCATTTSGFATLTVTKIESATITGSTSTDQNSTMPTITFSATGGTKPYTFSYTLNGDPKTVTSVGNASTAIASQPTTQAGTFVYELKSVSDGTSCGYTPATTQSVTVNVTPLPVTLTTFTVAKEGNAAILNWETTTETNSDRFEIERSKDGKSWSIIGLKNAGGESASLLKYSFTDNNTVSGENLYRLKMIDKDLTFAYSRIRSLTFDLASQTSLYPNPVSDQLHLNIADWNKVTSVELLSVKGQSVYKSGKTLKSTIDVSGLSTGIYLVSVRYTDGSTKAFKIMVTR